MNNIFIESIELTNEVELNIITECIKFSLNENTNDNKVNKFINKFKTIVNKFKSFLDTKITSFMNDKKITSIQNNLTKALKKSNIDDNSEIKINMCDMDQLEDNILDLEKQCKFFKQLDLDPNSDKDNAKIQEAITKSNTSIKNIYDLINNKTELTVKFKQIKEFCTLVNKAKTTIAEYNKISLSYINKTSNIDKEIDDNSDKSIISKSILLFTNLFANFMKIMSIIINAIVYTINDFYSTISNYIKKDNKGDK